MGYVLDSSDKDSNNEGEELFEVIDDEIEFEQIQNEQDNEDEYALDYDAHEDDDSNYTGDFDENFNDDGEDDFDDNEPEEYHEPIDYTEPNEDLEEDGKPGKSNKKSICLKSGKQSRPPRFRKAKKKYDKGALFQYGKVFAFVLDEEHRTKMFGKNSVHNY